MISRRPGQSHRDSFSAARCSRKGATRSILRRRVPTEWCSLGVVLSRFLKKLCLTSWKSSSSRTMRLSWPTLRGSRSRAKLPRNATQRKSPKQPFAAQRKLMLHPVRLQLQHRAQCPYPNHHRRHQAQGDLMLHAEANPGVGIVITMDHAASGAIIKAIGGTAMTSEAAGSSGDVRLASVCPQGAAIQDVAW